MLINAAKVLFEEEFDAAISHSAKMLDGEFIAEGTEDAYLDCWEDIHHCGTCITREVMNVMWPSIEKYINSLEFIIQHLDARDLSDGELLPAVDAVVTEVRRGVGRPAGLGLLRPAAA